MSSRAKAMRCCPSCAASLGRRPGRRARLLAALHRRRLRRSGPVPRAPGSRARRLRVPGRAWVGLLLVAAAAIPVAAAGGAGAALGFSSPVPPPTPVAPPDPPPADLIRHERAGPLIEWRESQALGSPNGGTLVDGVRLPASGTGFYTYDPRTQRPPGSLGRRWGTAMLIREVLELGEWWAGTHPSEPPLGIGDLARESGGPIDMHASHQNGLDVDIRLPRRDDVRGPADPGTYDRELAQSLVDRLVDQGATLVLIGPSLDLYGPPGVAVRWPEHDDHLHVRFQGDPGAGGD